MSALSILKQIKEIPKVELHAHLNGSISRQTLKKLIQLKDSTNKHDINSIPDSSSMNLSECFKVFEVIHKVLDTTEAVYLATRDVIDDFRHDNVVYLELRTTPKETSHMSREQYVASVLRAIEDAPGEMMVKLLLSIDRKRDALHARETVRIAERLLKEDSVVVGIDFSGDPTKGDVIDFIPHLKHAQDVGLKLAIHIAEVAGNLDEVAQLLRLRPSRLGHGTFLHPLKSGCSENFQLLQKAPIPLEVCLSSNVISQTVPSLDSHHFQLFRQMGYPMVLCTDDKGVFDTSLTNEYLLAAQTFDLEPKHLFDMAYKSIDYTFASEAEKETLRSTCRRKYTSTEVEKDPGAPEQTT